MVSVEKDSGCASVAVTTGPGDSPREAKPQDTGIPEAQTPPKESALPSKKESVAGSPSGDSPAENTPHKSTKTAAAATNDNLGRKATDNVSHEAGEASKSTPNSSDPNKAQTTKDMTDNTGRTGNGLHQPAAPDRDDSKTDIQKPSPVVSEAKSTIVGVQPIAPAPTGGVGGMGNAPLPLAAAPSGSHHPHTPVSAPVVPPPSGSSGSKKAGSSLRRGKWTVEEEAYVARVIQDFNSGFLNAPAGTTLRSYLSEKLQCDPMRITKKFTGESCIGKRVFHPAVRSASNASAIDKAQAELESLERRWRRRLEMQQRESAKKAAASAAAAAAASGRNHGFVTHGMGTDGAGGHTSGGNNGVAQTATWLDRASHILKGSGSQTGQTTAASSQQKFSLTREQVEALQSLPKKEIEMQMKEVERLIHEGPIIQQTTAGLGHVADQSTSANEQHKIPSMIVAHSNSSVSDGQQTPPEPADKRMRTGAEDAEALVGFLTAVRASAAAGTDSLSG